MASKQAVLLIHGIGEQRPMDTLRDFVDAVWTSNDEIHHEHAPKTVWSKPDSVSENFELRRLTTARNVAGIRSDFFEFYWAHLISGTKTAHVAAWAKTLLFRPPGSVPSQLKLSYWLLVVAIILTLFFAAVTVYLGSNNDSSGLTAVVSALATLFILPAAGRVLKLVIGDAARYLHVAPDNIKRRADIRHAGVTLLKTLHTRGYERIVVVGHSLGSVIAYDILTYAWADMNSSFEVIPDRPKPDPSPLLAIDHDSDTEETQSHQRRYASALIASGHPWRVTDLVTLGSPLAHADILLARSLQELSDKQSARELPTCPPTLESEADGSECFTFDHPLPIAGGQKDGDPAPVVAKFPLPHHAAVFGPTRWTNLYFPCTNIIKGDIVAGPLGSLFGPAIKDIPVCTNLRGGYLTHTMYWAQSENDRAETHLTALRDALDLADTRGALSHD